MKVTREMIGAAHDVMLARGDFVLSAAMLEKIYIAMHKAEGSDWEHKARLLDGALQELIVFVDERWGDNECRPLENAKHALGLVKDEE